MKVVKIPTKIYAPGGIEFIRKEKILKLIEEESRFWDDGEMIFRELIDKINSL